MARACRCLLVRPNGGHNVPWSPKMCVYGPDGNWHCLDVSARCLANGLVAWVAWVRQQIGIVRVQLAAILPHTGPHNAPQLALFVRTILDLHLQLATATLFVLLYSFDPTSVISQRNRVATSFCDILNSRGVLNWLPHCGSIPASMLHTCAFLSRALFAHLTSTSDCHLLARFILVKWDFFLLHVHKELH